MRACALALLLWASTSAAQWRELSWVDPSLRWRTLDTAHFSVHFAEPFRPQARVVASIAEAVYPRVAEMLDWRVESRIHLLLLDSADFANGFASVWPFNYFAVFLSPPDEGELLQNQEWLRLVLTHELFHIVHLDKAHGRPHDLRRVFGRLPFLFPNALQPRWVIEGLAVYAESEPGSGNGRLGQSQFEGMMRAERARGLRSLHEVNAEGRRFPLNREYLYGSYFFAFLRERYGPEATRRFIESYSGNLVPFKVDSTAVQATGRSMDLLWLEYHDWLRARFAARPSPSDAAGTLLVQAFAISSPVLGAEGNHWYVQGDGYIAPRLVRQARGGTAQTVREVEQDTRLAVLQDGTLLAAQPDICGNYNYLYDLYEVKPDGGLKRLTRCARFRYAAALDDGRIAALRVEAGTAEVMLLDRHASVARRLYRAAPGEALTGLAARGSSVVVTSHRAGRWALMEIGSGEPSVLVSDGAIKHSPRFGDSAEEIYFVANYGNVYNVWSVRRGERSASRWSEALHGVREISAPVAREILLTTIEADGDALRILRLPERPLERLALRSEVDVASTANETAPTASGADRPYSPWPSLRPHAWLPVIQIGDGAVELGVTVFGHDALGIHRYLLAPRYEFTQDEALGDFEYLYDGRHGIFLSRWMTVESQGESDNGLAGREISAYSIHEQAQWLSTWRALALNRRFHWGLGAALQRERLREVGTVAFPVHDERVIGLVAGVDTRRERWFSEGPSQGQQLRLFAETSSGLGGTYSGNVYRADWRAYVPLGRTVLAVRWNEAHGDGRAEPFQLGGSESDEFSTLPLLNEREFALRGYLRGEPSLTGHRARVATVEWRAPLADIDRHLISPPVGLNRIAVNVFADVGAAWEGGTRPDYHRGVGVELMSELRFGYFIGLHARAGIAKGIDAPGSTTAYLRIGRSF